MRLAKNRGTIGSFGFLPGKACGNVKPDIVAETV